MRLSFAQGDRESDGQREVYVCALKQRVLGGGHHSDSGPALRESPVQRGRQSPSHIVTAQSEWGCDWETQGRGIRDGMGATQGAVGTQRRCLTQPGEGREDFLEAAAAPEFRLKG